MLRNIIKIDRDACDGCGLCINACHEKALELRDGKAELIGDSYCDGLEACLSACPRGAISFERREAGAYNEAGGPKRQWPIQLKLARPEAAFFKDADLLVAADCAAFVHRNFAADFIAGRIVLIGCPKLDGADYSETLGAVFSANAIRSVTVVKMEVPCCNGIDAMARKAAAKSGKAIPIRTATLSIDGAVLPEG
ncbi:MAG: 4Fe-4S binding protein [Treponema sp.]|jgi:NAD-dependent dihydropyrimidine dehydrogenase PreA subunit|nr:4Fe-4S binding protein [Treponema sp.]